MSRVVGQVFNLPGPELVVGFECRTISRMLRELAGRLKTCPTTLPVCRLIEVARQGRAFELRGARFCMIADCGRKSGQFLGDDAIQRLLKVDQNVGHHLAVKQTVIVSQCHS